jgi:hypothetical protein
MVRRISKRKHKIVSQYARMWPREVFNVREGNQYYLKFKTSLSKPGVYVLYRDDHPYYIGKASKKLFNRLRDHAVKPKDRYYNFWNFFSAFVVNNSKDIPEVEGILIAAMPTDNSAIPRIHKIHIPSEIAKAIMRKRRIALFSGENDR